MLKCTMCGRIEKCCHLLCPVCGERMVRLEEYNGASILETMTEKVGDPLYPEVIRTQCKVCSKRGPLYLVTDYKLGRGLSLGVCRECYFSQIER